MAFLDPADPQAVPQPVRRVSDANNPAAQQFALSRLHQLVQAHLLGAMPQNMTDPAQVWRGLSATFQNNPQALQAFLAANRPAPAQQPILAGATDGVGGGPRYTLGPAPAPRLVSENGYQAPPVHEMPRQLPALHPTIAAILNALASGNLTQYGGRH